MLVQSQLKRMDRNNEVCVDAVTVAFVFKWLLPEKIPTRDLAIAVS